MPVSFAMTKKEFNSCVDQYADGVYRFVLKNTGDEDMAQDIVQESFTRMWQKVSDIAYDKSKSYLFTTAYHTMIDLIRKEERLTRLEDWHHNSEAEFNTYSDLKEVLNKALSTLPEKQRTVVLLRDYEGYSYDEIGGITGLSEAQVKVYIFRARKSLRNYITKIDYVLEDK